MAAGKTPNLAIAASFATKGSPFIKNAISFLLLAFSDTLIACPLADAACLPRDETRDLLNRRLLLGWAFSNLFLFLFSSPKGMPIQ
jgi:hypothetical protein